MNTIYDNFDQVLNYYKENGYSIKQFLKDYYPFDPHNRDDVDKTPIPQEELIKAYREIYRIKAQIFDKYIE
jgi:hypothetical protein